MHDDGPEAIIAVDVGGLLKKNPVDSAIAMTDQIFNIAIKSVARAIARLGLKMPTCVAGRMWDRLISQSHNEHSNRLETVGNARRSPFP
jgi:hypothetical protein